jgi:hypothetical protein
MLVQSLGELNLDTSCIKPMKLGHLLNNVSLLLCHCGFKASEEWQYMQERAGQV